jgi:hypothetical protein
MCRNPRFLWLPFLNSFASGDEVKQGPFFFQEARTLRRKRSRRLMGEVWGSQQAAVGGGVRAVSAEAKESDQRENVVHTSR